MQQLEIRELSPTVGAEIIGFDPNAEIDQDTWDLLSKTFDERGMLAFRNIDLSVARQHEIVEILHAGGDTSAPEGIDAERFSYVSNKEEKGGAPYGRLLFHADMMWSDIAFQTPSLYAVEAQQPATPTIFVNTVHAWKTLPEDMKERLKGLSARHESGQQGRGDTEYEGELIQPQWGKLRDTVKPIATPHPRTGETMLYICEQQTREIVGLPKAESDALLDQLFQHMYRPENIMAHQWRTGDLVIWDNMFAQHGRPYVEGGGPARTLRKIHAPNKVLDAFLKQIADLPTYERAM
ncbi:taurine dioxygenase [Novosphingobium sp. CF614]|uniref:TauD/TfdA dioxygenase family protein n=1 Tax=Novosphingobium sp. CF614 TaxID=1884364 RepID=UPI0008F0BEB0|nr:TauD/TfdA family dioxygenase [Novosphingobium sp. CF614]SFF76995.1 taurine dioxygenase [Novosphingobium sp. CF614]